MQKLGLLFLVILSLLFSACGGDHMPVEDSLSPFSTHLGRSASPQPSRGGESKTSFQEDVLPIIEKNCRTCHNGQGLPDWNDYQTAKSKIARILSRLKNNSMPPAWSGRPPLPQEEKEIFEKWAKDGMPE